MNRLLTATALLLMAWPLPAAEHARPARLTVKEIADGWLLLFDGETTFGWRALNDSKYTISLGMIAPQAESKNPLLVTTTAFGDYELSLEYRMKDDSKPKVLVGCDRDGKNRGPQDTVDLRDFRNDWMRLVVTVKGGRVQGSQLYQGDRDVSFFIGGGAVVSPDEKQASGGHIALAGSGVVFRNVKLRPNGLKSIFNGKDLSGWKKYDGDPKRAISEFTVKEGAIHVKNGPGDLQTEGQYDDFILQLECISNGKHLNSGVFFRCLPGQYQQGYEAQVHNGFGEEPKEYTLEDYDPQTHKLLGTRKEKYKALDYGTGAIYRRQPARMQMAKDGEWFGMTVVAEGRHIGVWVNGVMVTDWTDNRPENDNARMGAKLGKGAISLQGHDPTTDLSFRHFRIAELGKRDEKKD